MRRIGIFGGAFDPVHCGHLRTMLELREVLSLDELRVIPSGRPPHRAPAIAGADARIRMLAAALAGLDGLVLDDREVRRPEPSWTVVTLESLRTEFPDASLSVLLGSDAFSGLPTWHRWRELLELAHIVVARRPGAGIEVPQELEREMATRASDVAGLAREKAGFVAFCETSQLDVSSSRIRELAAARRTLRWLVPESVERLIEENEWYRTAN
jgi:nicotinate-nucleotide adenylyltransferase